MWQEREGPVGKKRNFVKSTRWGFVGFFKGDVI